MAHTVTITHGSTTITLTLVDNTPSSAPADQETVTERWEVFVEGATLDLLLDAIHDINQAFELARQQKKDSHLDRVYLNFLPKDLADSQRSQIVDGRIEYYDETLKWGWANKGFDVRLVITRKNYWEGDLTEIPLTNSNGTSGPSGLHVFNCNDGSGVSPSVLDNYADIDADDLEGDLPAPIKFVMTTDDDLEDIILCLIRSGTPSGLQHMAEGEDDTSVSSGVDATCSGGEYGIGQFTDVNTEVEAFSFYSGTEWPDLEIGRWYLPLIRLRTVPTIADLWTKVKFVAGLTSETAWIKFPATGGPQVIQYPPLRLALPRWDVGDYLFKISFKTSTSGTKTIHVDYIYLLPVDGVRKYTVSLENLYGGYVGSVTDDPYEGTVFKYENHTTWRSLILVRGEPLMVDPRHDARIYFMSPGNTAGIDVWVDMHAYYRPRRLAL